MYLEQINSDILIKDIITTPKLWETQYGQQLSPEEYTPEPEYLYYLIKEEQNILGLFQVRDFTKICLEAHIHLLPAYWGKNYSSRAIKALFEYFKHSKYNSIITDVPKSCTHVIELLLKMNCKLSGFIPDAVIYNNQLMGLYLFSHSLIENQE